MGILANFKKQETDRINRLFEIVDHFAGPEISLMLSEIFEAYHNRGMIAVSIINRLQEKIAKVCAMPPDCNRDIARFMAAFGQLNDSEKRCLLVTICNDICKLGVMEESALSLFLIERLRQTPKSGGATPDISTSTTKEKITCQRKRKNVT